MENNLKFYLDKTLKEHFALGAFNFFNMESLQAIIDASLKTNSPAIMQVSESALRYMGEDFVTSLAKTAKKFNPALFLHLDHGKSFEICKKAVDLGFDSVMIDGSDLSFSQNKSLTKKVALYAHSKGVLVEGELGQIKGVEDDVDVAANSFTSPEKALEFVKKTNVDMLAVAIGTSHGINKFSRPPCLRVDLLQQIEKLLPCTPLVLHGASTIDKEIVKTFNDFGGKLEKANGLSQELLKKIVKEHNIAKVNTDSDLRLSFTSQLRKELSENRSEFNPRSYLDKAREKTAQILVYKMENVFYSAQKKQP